MHHTDIDPSGAEHLSISGSGSFCEEQVCLQQYVIHLRKCGAFRHSLMDYVNDILMHAPVGAALNAPEFHC